MNLRLQPEMVVHQAIRENSAHFDREFKGIGRYTGEFVEVQGDKVAQGRGRFEYVNGDVYEGEYQAGCRHGKGTCTLGDGITYQGEWVQDHMQGFGNLVYTQNESTYSGEFYADYKQGKGQQTFADGAEYLGEFFQNKKHGVGKFKHSDGSTFDGEWQHGMMHGKGTYWNEKSGWKYVGEWCKGHRNGHGKLCFRNGDVYDGEFEIDKQQGQGRIQYQDGGYYKGEWQANRKTGEGVLVSVNGERYAGFFNHGLRDGYGQQTYANLDSYEGRWAADTFEGWGRLTYTSMSEVFEGLFSNGQRHGEGELRRHGNLVYRGEWAFGEMHGRGERNSEDGSLYIGEFKNGQRSGRGTLHHEEWKFEGQFQDDKRHGQGIEEWSDVVTWVEYADGRLVSCSLAQCPSTRCVAEQEPLARIPKGDVQLNREEWTKLRVVFLDEAVARKVAIKFPMLRDFLNKYTFRSNSRQETP